MSKHWTAESLRHLGLTKSTENQLHNHQTQSISSVCICIDKINSAGGG